MRWTAYNRWRNLPPERQRAIIKMLRNVAEDIRYEPLESESEDDAADIELACELLEYVAGRYAGRVG